MLELVVSVCLLEDHSRCKDVSLTYMAESMTPMQCMMASPSEIAKWAEGNRAVQPDASPRSNWTKSAFSKQSTGVYSSATFSQRRNRVSLMTTTGETIRPRK